MKAARFFAITALLFAVLRAASAMPAAEDISGLLEKRGPAAKEIVTEPTIFRESEFPHLPVSLKQFEFLLDHPRLSMVLARIYDPSLDSYKVEVRPDGLIHVDDPPGLAGDAEIVDSGPGRRIYLISGYFDILMIRFNGRMVLVTVYSGQPGGSEGSVNSTTAAYIKVNSAIAGVFARLVTFLFPKKVDERIGRFVHAVKTAAFAVNKDPADAFRRLTASGKVGSEELKGFAGMFLNPETGNPRAPAEGAPQRQDATL